jgi:hypothetical protein
MGNTTQAMLVYGAFFNCEENAAAEATRETIWEAETKGTKRVVLGSCDYQYCGREDVWLALYLEESAVVTEFVTEIDFASLNERLPQDALKQVRSVCAGLGLEPGRVGWHILSIIT